MKDPVVVEDVEDAYKRQKRELELMTQQRDAYRVALRLETQRSEFWRDAFERFTDPDRA